MPLPQDVGTALGMNVAELIDAVNNELPNDFAPGTVEVIKLLNEGMTEIGRRFDIPRKSLVITPVPRFNEPIEIGSQVSSHKAITITDNSAMPEPYQIVNINEAGRIFPNWRETEQGIIGSAPVLVGAGGTGLNGYGLYRPTYGVAILQPGNPTAKLILKPRLTATEVYIETSVKPLPLRAFPDYPFMTDIAGQDSSGAYPEFDVALVYFALFRLLSRASQSAAIENKEMESEAYKGRAQMFYQAYKSVEPDLYEYGSNDVIYPRRRI